MDRFVKDNNVAYFHSLGVEFIVKEITKVIGNKYTLININKIKTYHSIRSEYFRIGFIDSMLNSKSFVDYTNLFSSHDYEKNDKIILKYFQ